MTKARDGVPEVREPKLLAVSAVGMPVRNALLVGARSSAETLEEPYLTATSPKLRIGGRLIPTTFRPRVSCRHLSADEDAVLEIPLVSQAPKTPLRRLGPSAS